MIVVAWFRYAFPVALVGLLVAPLFGACDGGGGGSSSSSAGSGDGGCPPIGPPEPLFTIHIVAAAGSLPNDMTLQVTWSAGQEPLFALQDPESWKTLEDGSNVACDIDRDAGSPGDLEQLSCELWTSGATLVEVSGTGFVPFEETLTPEKLDDCEAPVPSDVDVELVVDHDAGTGD
jgi:hypothetical protein